MTTETNNVTKAYSTAQYGSASLTGYRKFCGHSGVRELWDLPNGGSLYAGAEAHLRGQYSVIVDCTGYAFNAHGGVRASASHRTCPLTFDAGAEGFASLADHIAQPTPRVHIDWPDGGAPPLAPSFWAELLARASGSIAVCCVGGHGRTGTALAALYMAQHGGAGTDLTLTEVVGTVRKLHCAQAVETDEQVLYLETVADYYGVIVTDEIVEGSYMLTKVKPPATSSAGESNGPGDWSWNKTLSNAPQPVTATNPTGAPLSKRQRRKQRRGKPVMQHNGGQV